MKISALVLSAALVASSTGAALAQQINMPSVSTKYGATPTTEVVAPAPAPSPAVSGPVVFMALGLLALAVLAND